MRKRRTKVEREKGREGGREGHLPKSEEETEKNLQSASVATALARKDLPVPGGP